MAIDDRLIDELLKDYKNPEEIIGTNGLLKQLTKAVLERVLEGEMTAHLGYEKHDPAGHRQGNPRNGKSRKILRGEFGQLEIETPRDRHSTFEPKIVGKRQTFWTGFDDKILSMYARGMTTREIQGHLEDVYGIQVSPASISRVTEAVIEEFRQWQSRRLDEVYPIAYLDAVTVKVRNEGHIQNKAVYVVLGIKLEGRKEVLGLWAAETEGTKFWLRMLAELKDRGVKDIFLACIDGFKGFPEAIDLTYPRTVVQLCIVHMVRSSLNNVPWKRRKDQVPWTLRKSAVADLQAIYRATDVAEAERALVELEAKWKAYPSVSQVWRRNWAQITPFFNYPPQIRRAIYTTNNVVSLNRSLNKIVKIHGGFPSEEAALKLLFLALRQTAKKWTTPIPKWDEALNHFATIWPERMPALEKVASDHDSGFCIAPAVEATRSL